MLILGFTLLLTVIGIAVMPCWRYSARWGYGPGIGAGILLVCMGVFTAGGRAGPSDALAERFAARPRAEIKVEASSVALAPLPHARLGIVGTSAVVSAE
ncbi:MAG: hypothetical protein A3D94_10455 [Alphaproteobacteria bacterium RIFCSPHIGHO2_12_FULL_66_14]|jgi:hypothetical protein|nr:MAG: hypothetical protein A3D94_10455 [Alphaproteobacteria bacterium RIFCSPHIGHO2_12_FULL_66_14]